MYIATTLGILWVFGLFSVVMSMIFDKEEIMIEVYKKRDFRFVKPKINQDLFDDGSITLIDN